MLTLVYLVLALLGCGYVIVATLLGHLMDAGDGDGGDGHGHAGEFHYPFFSPLALAALFGALGGFGLIAKYGFRVGDGVSLAIAGPAALFTSYLVTYGTWRLARSSTGSSQIRTADLTGAVGEVVTPIPAGGLGEVTVMVEAQRFTAPARAASGDALPRGTIVIVEHYSGSTMVVTARKPGEVPAANG